MLWNRNSTGAALRSFLRYALSFCAILLMIFRFITKISTANATLMPLCNDANDSKVMFLGNKTDFFCDKASGRQTRRALRWIYFTFLHERKSIFTLNNPCLVTFTVHFMLWLIMWNAQTIVILLTFDVRNIEIIH